MTRPCTRRSSGVESPLELGLLKVGRRPERLGAGLGDAVAPKVQKRCALVAELVVGEVEPLEVAQIR